MLRDVISRYNASGDRGDLESLAGCFTEDGTLAIKGREPFVGRAVIIDGLTVAFRPDPRVERPPIGYLHHGVTTLDFVSVSPRGEHDVLLLSPGSDSIIGGAIGIG